MDVGRMLRCWDTIRGRLFRSCTLEGHTCESEEGVNSNINQQVWVQSSIVRPEVRRTQISPRGGFVRFQAAEHETITALVV